MKRMLLVVALAGLLALASACGGDGEVTIRGDDGEVTFRTGGDLPDDFPDDFPIFEGADLVSAVQGDQEGVSGFIVLWETDASPEDVEGFYREELDKDPWKSAGVFSSAEGTVISFTRSDNENFGGGVTISGNDRTQVAAFLGEGEDFGPGGDISEEEALPAEEELAEEAEPSGGAELPAEEELPADYPSDIAPIPDGARVTEGSSLTADGQSTFTITFLTEDSPEAVADFYDEEVPGDGWSRVGRFSSEGSIDLSYQTEDETGFLIINVSPSDEFEGFTEVLLLLTTQG